MSALGLAALASAQRALAAGVRGGVAPYGRFRSPDIDGWCQAVGLIASSADVGAQGWPWCAAFVRACFEDACGELEDAQPAGSAPIVNPCPRTASALHLFNQAPTGSERSIPAPGDVFVLVHHDGIHGHTGIVESCTPDGQTITTVEGDTDAEGSSTGDAVGRHTRWSPADGSRGKLVGYLDIG